MSSWSDEQRAEYVLSQKYKTPIADLKLPVRVINTLEEHSVLLVEDLMKQTHETLMRMKNFGDKTLSEVENAVRKLGLEPPAAWKRTTRSRRKS